MGEAHSFRVNQDADFLKFLRDEGGVDFFKSDLRKEKDQRKVAHFLGLNDKWNHLEEKHAQEKTSNRKVLFDFFGMVAEENETEHERWMHDPIEMMHRTLASLHLYTGSRIDLSTACLEFGSMRVDCFDFPAKSSGIKISNHDLERRLDDLLNPNVTKDGMVGGTFQVIARYISNTSASVAKFCKAAKLRSQSIFISKQSTQARSPCALVGDLMSNFIKSVSDESIRTNPYEDMEEGPKCPRVSRPKLKGKTGAALDLQQNNNNFNQAWGGTNPLLEDKRWDAYQLWC